MRRVAVIGLGCTPALPPAARDAQRDAWIDSIEESPYATAKGWRRMSWESKLAYYAFQMAIDAAHGDEVPPDRLGLVVGSRYGCLSLFEEFHRALRDEGANAVSPTVFTTGVLNAPTGHASLGQGLRGPCHTLVGSEAAGLEAVALGWELLRTGALDRVLAIGVEEAPPILLEALRVGGARPAGRPVAEGAAALLLEADGTGGGAELHAVATGRCGRRHDSTERHARLIQAVAGDAPVHCTVIPGTPGADGSREQAAVRRALGGSAEVTAAADGIYAPGFVSALAAHSAATRAAQGHRVIATAAGGRGNTVAIRFDPPSPSAP